MFWLGPTIPSHLQLPYLPRSFWHWYWPPSPAQCELVCGWAPSASSLVPPAGAGIWSGSAQLVLPTGQFMCEKEHYTPLTALQYHPHLLPCAIQTRLACHFTNYKESITMFVVLVFSHQLETSLKVSNSWLENKSSPTHSETHIKSVLVRNKWISSTSFRISHSISRGTLTKFTSLSKKSLITNSPSLIKATAANKEAEIMLAMKFKCWATWFSITCYNITLNFFHSNYLRE